MIDAIAESLKMRSCQIIQLFLKYISSIFRDDKSPIMEIMERFDGLHYIGARAPLHWSLGSNILEPLLFKSMFLVSFLNMKHGKQKVSSQ